MFSVAEQRVVDPVTGAVVTFAVDPADTAIVRCLVGHVESNDYVRLDFQRNGTVTKVTPVDAEVEADQAARKAAQARLNATAAVGGAAISDEEKKAAAEAAAKQVAEDKALLASPSKVSKFATEEEKAAAAGKPAPEKPAVTVTPTAVTGTPVAPGFPPSERPRP